MTTANITPRAMIGDIPVYCAHDELADIMTAIPNPKNPNTHPDRQIQMLAQIIKSQGWRKPITISNRSGFVVSGHGRLQAAFQLGIDKVPVDYQNYESEAAEHADLVADNRIAELSETDDVLMAEILKELEGMDMDMSLTGYDDEALEELFADYSTDNSLIDLEEDEHEVELPEEPKAKLGDIYQLGNHRLMCGDSTDKEDVARLLAGESIDMVFTDPPYNVAFNGRSGSFDVIENDNLSAEEFEKFIRKVTDVIKWVAPASYYIWCNWKFYGVLQNFLPFKACIVWAKNVFGLGKGYRHQHEFCLFNGAIDDGITNESDLWEIAKDANYMHPTQKPIALCGRALQNHSGAQMILDLFGGSGSTLIACEQLGRTCYTMEIDPGYVDVIISRWEQFTGEKAILLNDKEVLIDGTE